MTFHRAEGVEGEEGACTAASLTLGQDQVDMEVCWWEGRVCWWGGEGVLVGG